MISEGEGSLIAMDLLNKIRTDRARQRRKRACKRDVFNTVSGIVKEYGLGDEFLKLIEETGDWFSLERIEFNQAKAKKTIELPLFSLVSEGEYRLIMAILVKLDNPYLRFARSPEEMLLSDPLYRANPSLKSEDLLRYDFETLLSYLSAKRELAAIEPRQTNRGRELGQVTEMEEENAERFHLSSLRERIEQLQTFIARVEKKEPQRK